MKPHFLRLLVKVIHKFEPFNSIFRFEISYLNINLFNLGHENIADLLIRNGADINIVNNQGKSAFDLGSTSGKFKKKIQLNCTHQGTNMMTAGQRSRKRLD